METAGTKFYGPEWQQGIRILGVKPAVGAKIL